MATASDIRRAAGGASDGERRIVLRGISWATYEALSRESGHNHVRMAYDRGDLELMSPSPLHERYKAILGRFVQDVLVGLRVRFEAAGESRWKNEAARRGLEPDDCFFITAEKLAVVAGRPADREDDPTPDLAVEVDVSRPEIDRMAIYAALGIPEVWRYDGVRLRIEGLRPDGTYEERAESRFLPLRADEVSDWVRRADGADFLAWIEALRDWVRDALVPRRAGG